MKLTACRIDYIVLSVDMGSILPEIVLEACKVSLEYHSDVKFKFNGKWYEISFNDFHDMATEVSDGGI